MRKKYLPWLIGAVLGLLGLGVLSMVRHPEAMIPAPLFVNGRRVAETGATVRGNEWFEVHAISLVQALGGTIDQLGEGQYLLHLNQIRVLLSPFDSTVENECHVKRPASRELQNLSLTPPQLQDVLRCISPSGKAWRQGDEVHVEVPLRGKESAS